MPTPTRVERLKLTLALTSEQVAKHASTLKEFLGYMPESDSGDTLRVNYSFSCEYFGQVERRLRLLLLLMEDALPVEANVEELQHGHSLIVEIVKSLTEIRSRLNANLP